MAILTSEATLIVEQGTPVTATETVTFLGIGSAGSTDAKRVLTHPNALLAPITYAKNPDRTLNLDNEVLFHPITDALLTLGSRRVVRFETAVDDVVATEIWEAADGTASMPTFLLRALYEYMINPPSSGFITWEPRNRSTKKYNVEFVRLRVGNEGDDMDVLDVRAGGGRFKGGDYDNALDALNALETGVVDREVRLVMRVVSEAS